MNVYLVWRIGVEHQSVDSVWSSAEKADDRVRAITARTSNVFTRCFIDGAWVMKPTISLEDDGDRYLSVEEIDVDAKLGLAEAMLPPLNPARVDCDEKCGALLHPVTAEETKAALEHWRDHRYLAGCSHAGM